MKKDLSSILSDLKKGEKATIVGFSNQEIPVKYYEMGLVPGTELECKCHAPFNGPMCVTLCKDKCVLALRKSEAGSVLIKKTQ